MKTAARTTPAGQRHAAAHEAHDTAKDLTEAVD